MPAGSKPTDDTTRDELVRHCRNHYYLSLWLTIEKSFGGNTFGYAALAIGETGERIIDYLPHPDQIYLEIRSAADPGRPPDLDEDHSPELT